MNNLHHHSVKVGDDYIFDESVVSAHVVVTDIRIDDDIPFDLMGICDEYTMCYRALVYLNGESRPTAVFATTPGALTDDGIYTPQSNLHKKTWRGNRTAERYYKAHNKTDDLTLGGKITNRFEDMYIMDHYLNKDGEHMPWAVFYNGGVAFHSSATVNGKLGSHGCTRLKYVEARMMNFLARHTKRNFTVETRFTERSKISDELRENGIDALILGKAFFQKSVELQEKADAGDVDAKSKLRARALDFGGLR